VAANRVYSILSMPAAAGREDELVRRFAGLRIFELAGKLAGLRAARLLRPSAPNEPFLVLAEWDTADAYRNWLAHDERARVNSELTPLLDGELRGVIYSVVDTWPPIDLPEGRRP
jgi:heme-degrading monooxygenase HmoA